MTGISVTGGTGLDVATLQAQLAALAVNADTSSNTSQVQSGSTSLPSSIVSLGQTNTGSDVQTYSAAGASSATSGTSVVVAKPLVWENSTGDAISTLMASDLPAAAASTAPFQGLGAVLLNDLKSGASNFSQAVLNPNASQLSGPQTTSSLSALLSGLHQGGDDQVTLDVETTSGVSVKISLDSQSYGLAVKMTTSGTLSNTERTALEGFANAFQAAIDGMSAVPPTVDLSGLTQFDPTVLKSVDLQVQMGANVDTVQTLAFHADSAGRSVSVSGPSGSLQMNVDMSDLQIQGTQAQQTQAIAQYMQQFDDAASRGNGNASLMAMFKDAFTDLNSPYNVSPAEKSAAALAPIKLQDQDHAMLTGLADFSASITQTAKQSNPMRLDEWDSFSYQVSQDTQISGNTELNRTVSQHQQSTLQASYHQTLVPGVALQLSSAKNSQNYYYDQINDTANSSASIGYVKGHVTQASLAQSATHSTHVMKYVLGDLMQDTTTPSNASIEQDVTPLLNAYLEDPSKKTTQQVEQLQQLLTTIHNMVFLQSDPNALQAQ